MRRTAFSTLNCGTPSLRAAAWLPVVAATLACGVQTDALYPAPRLPTDAVGPQTCADYPPARPQTGAFGPGPQNGAAGPLIFRRRSSIWSSKALTGSEESVLSLLSGVTWNSGAPGQKMQGQPTKGPFPIPLCPYLSSSL